MLVGSEEIMLPDPVTKAFSVSESKNRCIVLETKTWSDSVTYYFINIHRVEKQKRFLKRQFSLNKQEFASLLKVAKKIVDIQ